MADSAAEEKFPQPRAAAEEAPAAPGQAAPALQPESAQPAQNEAAERGANCLRYVLGVWLALILGVCSHCSLPSCLLCCVVLITFNHGIVQTLL